MTSNSPSIFIKEELLKEVTQLINQKTGLSVRNGVEIILKNDLNNNNNNNNNSNSNSNSNSVDVGDILSQGLSFLALCPFDTLDIPLNADINQIRKAYKKMALKYHPDKNPATTPLFQAIHSAYEKLTNESMKNEFQTPDPPPPTSSKPPEGTPPNKDNNENKEKKTNSESDKSNNTQKSNETKKSKAREKEKEDMKAFAESQQRAKMKERMRQEEEKKKKEEQKVETEEEKTQRLREAGRKKEMEEAEMRAAERRAKTGYGSRQTYYQRENIQRKERSSNGEEYPNQPPVNNHTTTNTNNNTNTNTNINNTTENNIPNIPTPIGLTGIAVDVGTVQLQWTPLSQWNPPPEVITKYHIELSWREVLVVNPDGFGYIDKSDAQWEIGSLMITGDKVMKRNLTPGSTYEFSIRYRTPASIDKKQQGNSSSPNWGYWCPEISVSIPYGRPSSKYSNKPNSSTGNRPSTASASTSSSTSRRKSNPDVSDHIPSMSSTQTQPQPQPQPQPTSTSKPISKPTSASKSTNQKSTKPKVPSESNSTSTTNSKTKVQSQSPSNSSNTTKPTSTASSSSSSSTSTASAPQSNFDFNSDIFPATNRPKYHENPELFEDDESSKHNLHKLQQEQSEKHNGNDIKSNPSNSLYHKYYGSAKSLPEEGEENIDNIFDDEMIVPDVWVDEGSSDEDSPQKLNSKQTIKTKWYQLIPPDSHIGSGRYVHSVHLLKDDNSQIIGYISTANKVLASKRLSDWMFVKTHWNTLKNPDDLATNKNESNSTNTPWGWVKRCAWNERLGRDHIFFHPIPKSVTSGLKYPTTKLTSNEHDDHIYDSDNQDETIHNQEHNNNNNNHKNNHNHNHNHNNDNDNDNDNYLTEDDEFEMNEELFREKMSKSFKKLASVPVWYEQFDTNGYPYYYNPKTGESKWEPPEWIEDVDPASGARYFVKLDRQNAAPLQSTWSMPQSFARLVRQQYT